VEKITNQLANHHKSYEYFCNYRFYLVRIPAILYCTESLASMRQ